MAGPTRERMNKPDWETHGRRRRRSNTLEALRPRVGDEVIAEAHRWIADWELAVNGYCDEMKNSGSPAIPGNVFTFNALRGQKWLPIRAFCRHAGQEAHMLLVQMLAHGWSFSSIGRSHWPELSENRARNRASEACGAALLALHDFWCQQRRAEAGRAIHAARCYRAYPSLPVLCKEFGLATPKMRQIIVRGETMLSRPKHSLIARAD